MDFFPPSEQWWDSQRARLSAELPQPCPTNLFKTPSPGNTDAAFINIISRSRAKASKTDSGKWMTTSRRIQLTLLGKIFLNGGGKVGLWWHLFAFIGFNRSPSALREVTWFKSSSWTQQQPSGDIKGHIKWGQDPPASPTDTNKNDSD